MKKAIVFLSFILGLSMVLLSCDKTSETTTTSNLPATTTSGYITTTTYTNTTIPTTTEIIETTNNIISYQVDFDANGGTEIDSMEAERGYPILLPVSYKEGYTFLGWFTSEDPFFYEFTLFHQVVSDMKLYAKWEINRYELSYDTQGGDLLSTTSIEFQDEITLATPSRVGHTFVGWYEDGDFTVPFELEVMPANHFTVYAKWSANTYKLTYHYDYPVEAEISFRLVGMGLTHTIAVANGGRVFAWGSNYSGQLGDGTVEKRSFPVEITDNIPFLESDYITKIECGAYFTLLLTNQSRVIGFGSNSSFQLAIDTGEAYSLPVDITDLLLLEVDETIVDISSGNFFTMLLTSNGRVLTWGSNFNAELGIGTSISDHLVHDITGNFNLDSLDSIVRIGTGDNHGIAISSRNRVFTWGINFNGQLGDGTTIKRELPEEISSAIAFDVDETIVVICGSSDFTLVLTNNGRIYAWGNNYDGHFGNGNTTNSLFPILVEPEFNLGIGQKITYLTAGPNHVMALSSDYRVFVWGSNYYNQFGLSTPATSSVPIDITTTLMNELYYPPLEIAAGGNASIVMSSYGSLLTFGNSSYGQLGTLEVSILNRPTIYVTRLVEVLYGDSIGFDVDFYEGYEFDGWYSEDELTIPNDYLMMPAMDIDLYGTYVSDDS